MKTFTFPQYSDEWWEARRGLVTCSGMDRIITPKTMKIAAAHVEYIYELIGDIATPGSIAPAGFMSPAMRNGQFLEPEARAFYCMERDIDVAEVGGCLSDCGRWWSSPDGLVGDEGGLECKCPLAKTQVKYLLEGALPDEYKMQVHGSLIVTGRKWWDFLSYFPTLPPFLVRVEPNDFTTKLHEALEEFDVRYTAAKERIRLPLGAKP